MFIIVVKISIVVVGLVFFFNQCIADYKNKKFIEEFEKENY